MYDNNVLYTFVSSDFVAAQPASEGQVAIQFLSGTYCSVTAGTTAGTDSLAGQTFRVVKYNAAGVLEHSPWITDGKIIAANTSGYVAPVQDVWSIVCDAGVEKDELKSIWLVVHDTQTTFGNKAMMKNAVHITSSASETGAVIAGGLQASFTKNMSREPENYATAKLVSSEAGDALGAAADTVVGSKGSKTVTITDTGGDTSVTAVSAGDYFRAGTAVTDPIYKVVASTVGTGGGVLTLDRPLESAVNLLGTTAEVVTAADLAAATTTLVFTGNARTNFKPGIWKSMTYTFDLLGDDVGTVTHTTSGKEGLNTKEQIKQEEWFYEGHRGYGYRVDFLPVASQLTSESVYTTLCSGNGQRCTYLQWKDQNFVNIVGQEPASLIQAKIWLPQAENYLFNAVLNTANDISGLKVS